MSRQIYVNLAVKNLKRSVDFFSRLGFMYSRAFEDPDGHIREPFYMEPGDRDLENSVANR